MNHRPRMTLAALSRPLLLVLACLALQACSAARLAYEQAPTLAQWRLNSYLDLPSEQTQRVRADLDALHRWHRQAQLPRQIDQLRGVQQRLASDLTNAEACATFDGFRTQALDLLNQAEPTMVWLAMALQPEKIAHLERRLAKDNETWRDEWIDSPADAQLQARYEQWLSRSETLYGRLDAPQKSAIKAALAALPRDAQLDWALRQYRQQAIVGTLRDLQRDKPAPEEAQVQVRAALQRVLTPADPGLRAHALRLRQDSCQAFTTIHNATTAAQRANASRTLGRYETDFRALVIGPGQDG